MIIPRKSIGRFILGDSIQNVVNILESIKIKYVISENQAGVHITCDDYRLFFEGSIRLLSQVTLYKNSNEKYNEFIHIGSTIDSLNSHGMLEFDAEEEIYTLKDIDGICFETDINDKGVEMIFAISVFL